MPLLSLFSWPIATFLAAPRLIAELVRGDSVYATALGRFYSRQLELLAGRIRFPSWVGRVNIGSFVYQNFLAIWLCYVVLGRRGFVLMSMGLWFAVLGSVHPSAGPIAGVVLVSHIAWFLLAERGNYQTLGLVVGSLVLGLGADVPELIPVAMVVLALSSSSALLLTSLFGVFVLPLREAFRTGLWGVTFAIALVVMNYIFLRGRAAQSDQTSFAPFDGLLRVFGLIGAGKAPVAPFLTRSRDPVRGAVSAAPLLGFAVVQVVWGVEGTGLTLAFAAAVFLNQSQIFRLFDFHFIWAFAFLSIGGALAAVSDLPHVVLVCFFLLGSNPLVLVGLNRAACGGTRRWDRMLIPAYVGSSAAAAAEDAIERLLPEGQDLIVRPLGDLPAGYNDLWRRESVLLEFVWTAMSRKGPLFPDWYSLFYSDCGTTQFSRLFSPEGLPATRGEVVLHEDGNTALDGAVVLSDFFPNEAISTDFGGVARVSYSNGTER